MTFVSRVMVVTCLAVTPALAIAGTVSGTISSVYAGGDNWYGVRFYLNITSDQTNGECNSAFVYTEPEPDSGHKNKVAVFMAAYLAGKSVILNVSQGRNGYCKLVEGQVS